MNLKCLNGTVLLLYHRIFIKIGGKYTMKINWKVRLQSYPFWVALFGFVGLIVKSFACWWCSCRSYYSGLSDSKQPLNYENPKKN